MNTRYYYCNYNKPLPSTRHQILARKTHSTPIHIRHIPTMHTLKIIAYAIMFKKLCFKLFSVHRRGRFI